MQRVLTVKCLTADLLFAVAHRPLMTRFGRKSLYPIRSSWTDGLN